MSQTPSKVCEPQSSRRLLEYLQSVSLELAIQYWPPPPILPPHIAASAGLWLRGYLISAGSITVPQGQTFHHGWCCCFGIVVHRSEEGESSFAPDGTTCAWGWGLILAPLVPVLSLPQALRPNTPRTCNLYRNYHNLMLILARSRGTAPT